jgi:hypothetical protein
MNPAAQQPTAITPSGHCRPETGGVPTYCSYCFGHMRGPRPGYDAPNVSHGICPACKPLALEGLKIFQIREIRRRDIQRQAQPQSIA